MYPKRSSQHQSAGSANVEMLLREIWAIVVTEKKKRGRGEDEKKGGRKKRNTSGVVGERSGES